MTELPQCRVALEHAQCNMYMLLVSEAPMELRPLCISKHASRYACRLDLPCACTIYLQSRVRAGLQPGSPSVACVGDLGLATCAVLCVGTDEIGDAPRLVLLHVKPFFDVRGVCLLVYGET